MYQKHNYNLTIHLNGIEMKAIPKYSVAGNWLQGGFSFHQNKIFNFLLRRGCLGRNFQKLDMKLLGKRNELLLRMFRKPLEINQFSFKQRRGKSI
ncbi:hypothetical protein EQY74_03190 [Bacillus licheniformis]|nr:hypothetical protein EQY74_03190 [Bacillus licheniformis]